MAEILFNGKRLDEMKVVEIREELVKRGLPRKGIKSALIKRFEKVLLQEQLDKGSSTLHAADEDLANCSSEEGLETSISLDKTEELDLSEISFMSTHKKDEDVTSATEVAAQKEQFDNSNDDFCNRSTTQRLESVTSIIEQTFPKDEELIYEGDVENEDAEDTSQMELDVDYERDELIVDFTPGELDLDPRPSEDEKSASNKPITKADTSKLEKSEERCNVWVSGLSQVVTASDLKILFSPFGQVLSAKVVARARSAKSQRYGFVTMGTPEQVEKSIKSLNNTELKGNKIVVEWTKNSPFVNKQKKEELTDKDTFNNDTNNSKKTNVSTKSASNTDTKNKSASKNDSNKGSSNKGNNGSTSSGANNKRIISVEKNDGRKELYTASGKRRRDEQKGIDNNNSNKRKLSPRNRSPLRRSPRQRSRSPRVRSRSPRQRRRNSPRGRIVSHRLSPIRRISGPPSRRGVSPPRRPPSPPLHRRAPSPPPLHRRMSSPPLRRAGGGDDVRRDIMRREMERRDFERRDIRNRLGGRMAPPPPGPPPAVHEMEMRIEEQRRRMATEREREREALRRELQMEHARKEQELVRQMQEIQQREERERSMIERQQREFAQLQRTMRERESHIEAKEREMKEKEMRERQRLEAIERQKEKDIREKEKRYRDQLERDLKEREMLMHKEQETLRMKLREQERMLIDKEKHIRAEQEQLAKAKEDVERKQRRKDDGDIDRDRKDRGDARRGGDRLKDDKDDKDRLQKRSIDEGIFGRLGNRDNPSQTSGGASAIVKETQISPNVMYRRIEASGGSKPAVNRVGVGNPYSQNQTRSKALDSLSTNYATPRHSNNPVGYPQPSRYSTGQYTHNTNQSVGYGVSDSNSTANMGQFNSSSKLTSLLNNPEILNVLSNVARTSNMPNNGPPFPGNNTTGGRMGGNYGSNLGIGAGSVLTSNYHNYGSGGMMSGGGSGQGRPGFPGMGVGMGMSQSQFTKHVNKMPQHPDRYNRRGPPTSRPEPYFNKRM